MLLRLDKYTLIDCRSIDDQSLSIINQCRSSFDHCRSFVDYKRSNIDYHWSVADSYRPIVIEFLSYITMLIHTDLSADRCKLSFNTV